MTSQFETTKVLVGADPELFLVNAEGKFISSIGKIGGSKTRPFSIAKGCFVQEDNVAVEFNIPPADSVEKFLESIEYSLQYLTDKAKRLNLSLSITASKEFDEDQLQHIRAKMFGCDTDYNAWTNQPNPRPAAVNSRLRSCGGHVHFGTTLDKLQLARSADIYLGLPSVLEDADTERRQLYGQAGCYRPKPYGIEYRTLSNYWLKDKALMKLIYDRAQAAVAAVASGKTLNEEDGILVQEAINTSNKDLAKELMQAFA